MRPGIFQAEAERGDTASVRTRDAIRDTTASYLIPVRQGQENDLDKRL
jgi:hypothetical protein